MKVAVAIASRGRPLALIGVVMALSRLASGKHEVSFVIGADSDDPATAEACERLTAEVPIAVAVDTRSTIGPCWNRATELARGVDLVSFMSDRSYPVTPNWDDALAYANAQRPRRILWWSCPDDPGCAFPAIDKAWLDAVDWRPLPEIFPFWWTDTWNQEVDLMVHGGPSLKVQAYYAGARGATQNGRDFAFWARVFAETRNQRQWQAMRLAEAFGMPKLAGLDKNLRDYFAAYDKMMQERAPEFEARFGDKREPSPQYRAAKAKAEQLLAEAAA